MAQTRHKIILEQTGESSWTFVVRDAWPVRLGGMGKILESGRDSDYDCYVTPKKALKEAGIAIARHRLHRP